VSQKQKIRLQDMDSAERPQERLCRLGSSALSDAELLAMILRSGTKEFNVLELAKELLKDAGSLNNLLYFTIDDFKKIKGIGNVKALQFLTIMELSKRVLYAPNKKPLLNSPEKAYDYLLPRTIGLEIEKVWVLCLNRKNLLIKESLISSGIANSSLIHPREIFRDAIRMSASSIIVAHNHPSGDPYPSQADRNVAKQLLKSAKIIDIELLDFIIIGTKEMDQKSKGYYSFREEQLLTLLD
jgi:DNA repair protein RadC